MFLRQVVENAGRSGVIAWEDFMATMAEEAEAGRLPRRLSEDQALEDAAVEALDRAQQWIIDLGLWRQWPLRPSHTA